MKYLISLVLSIIFFSSYSQNEFELNFNTVIPFGDYSKNDLFYGMETIGYAKVGFGADFKYLYHFKQSRFKLGVGLNYFQNPYNYEKLNDAFNHSLGCDLDPFVCSFSLYFGWDKLTRVTDWKNIDINLISSINIIDTNKFQYNVLIGAGGTMLVSPKFYYKLSSYDEELDSNISFSFNFNTEQNFRYKLNENILFNTSLSYRVSKVHSKFTENLANNYVYYDFWQHTLSAKIGIIYILNAK